jgi:integrase
MASIVERPKKTGEITYQVKWRESGDWQIEKFADEDGARVFKGLVEAHGNRWPFGWVRGVGFQEEDVAPDDLPIVDAAITYIDKLTGVEDRTAEDYRRMARRHFAVLEHVTPAGVTVPATLCNLDADDVGRWVRLKHKGKRDPAAPDAWLVKPADPKSIRNWHGLLFSVLQGAVESEKRTKNPCKNTSLPRVDDETAEEMTFLEADEYARIRIEIDDPRARDLADFLVGTGLRWGEATALQVRDLRLRGDEPTATIQRAWKREIGVGRFLGPPKTRAGRRTLDLSPSQVDMCRRLTSGLQPEDFVFQTVMGNAWHHPNFHGRKWAPAVAAAIEKGLPKRPRIHDLRHTHVAWLIAARVPLPAIQARLGHESIRTTVDRYGHLVRGLGKEIAGVVEAALAVPAQQPGEGLRAV